MGEEPQLNVRLRHAVLLDLAKTLRAGFYGMRFTLSAAEGRLDAAFPPAT
jgi:hypothetical protein